MGVLRVKQIHLRLAHDGASQRHALALTGAWKKGSVRIPAPLLGVSYALVLTLALVLAPDSGKAFIYFQF